MFHQVLLSLADAERADGQGKSGAVWEIKSFDPGRERLRLGRGETDWGGGGLSAEWMRTER